MHPPKLVQIGWGHRVFVFEAITFGEGCSKILWQREQETQEVYVLHI